MISSIRGRNLVPQLAGLRMALSISAVSCRNQAFSLSFSPVCMMMEGFHPVVKTLARRTRRAHPRNYKPYS